MIVKNILVRNTKSKIKTRKSRRGYNIGSAIQKFIEEVKQMYTVYMKGNSEIYKAGFESWTAANKWGKAMFGPGNFEIERE